MVIVDQACLMFMSVMLVDNSWKAAWEQTTKVTTAKWGETHIASYSILPWRLCLALVFEKFQDRSVWARHFLISVQDGLRPWNLLHFLPQTDGGYDIPSRSEIISPRPNTNSINEFLALNLECDLLAQFESQTACKDVSNHKGKLTHVIQQYSAPPRQPTKCGLWNYWHSCAAIYNSIIIL